MPALLRNRAAELLPDAPVQSLRNCDQVHAAVKEASVLCLSLAIFHVRRLHSLLQLLRTLIACSYPRHTKNVSAQADRAPGATQADGCVVGSGCKAQHCRQRSHQPSANIQGPDAANSTFCNILRVRLLPDRCLAAWCEHMTQYFIQVKGGRASKRAAEQTTDLTRLRPSRGDSMS